MRARPGAGRRTRHRLSPRRTVPPYARCGDVKAPLTECRADLPHAHAAGSHLVLAGRAYERFVATCATEADVWRILARGHVAPSPTCRNGTPSHQGTHGRGWWGLPVDSTGCLVGNSRPRVTESGRSDVAMVMTAFFGAVLLTGSHARRTGTLAGLGRSPDWDARRTGTRTGPREAARRRLSPPQSPAPLSGPLSGPLASPAASSLSRRRLRTLSS